MSERKPIFFGDTTDPDPCSLFGTFSPPAIVPGLTPCGAAVLICSGPAANPSTASGLIPALARKLSQRSIASIELDFRGTGNSAGEISFDGWQRDVVAGEAELRARAGIDKVVVFGIGFGASFALLAARMRTDCPLIVLLDPVLVGNAYLQQQRDFAKKFQRTVPGSPGPLRTEAGEEMSGIFFPAPFVKELSQLNLCEDRTPIIPAIILLSSSMSGEHDTFAAFQRSRSVAVRREPWNHTFGPKEFVALIEEEVF